MTSLFSQFLTASEAQNIQNVHLMTLYQSSPGHFDALAHDSLQDVKTGMGVSGGNGVSVTADDLYPDLAGKLAVDQMYRNHMANKKPWLPLLAPNDFYTIPFAKHILVQVFGTAQGWSIP